MRTSLYSLLLLLLLCAGPVAEAQRVSNPSDVVSSGTSYRIFAQPGEPTIQVLVLGDASAGLYVIGTNTTLVELLALTGTGASAGESPDVSRDVTIRLMREQGGSRTIVYEQEFEGFLSEPASYPALQDGDIFTVEVTERRRIGFLQVLDVTARLSSITLLVLRLIDGF